MPPGVFPPRADEVQSLRLLEPHLVRASGHARRGVEAFAWLLYDGVWDYAYGAKATTAGVFVVPPSEAEEMYSPETFGRGASDRMIVE